MKKVIFILLLGLGLLLCYLWPQHSTGTGTDKPPVSHTANSTAPVATTATSAVTMAADLSPQPAATGLEASFMTDTTFLETIRQVRKKNDWTEFLTLLRNGDLRRHGEFNGVAATAFDMALMANAPAAVRKQIAALGIYPSGLAFSVVSGAAGADVAILAELESYAPPDLDYKVQSNELQLNFLTWSVIQRNYNASLYWYQKGLEFETALLSPAQLATIRRQIQSQLTLNPPADYQFLLQALQGKE